MQDISWSQLYQFRREAAAKLGRIFQLPIAKRVTDLLLLQVHSGDRVLEVGAGDRRLEQHLSVQREKVRYESMDIDPHGRHDYQNLADVPGDWDCIAALEVVEHLSLEEISPWLGQLGDLLRPGGRLVLSTPNTYYPPAYLRDATHRTPLCYDELAGLVAAAGLPTLGVWRIYNDPIHRKLLRRYLFGWLFRLIGIDFARQIVLIAEKPSIAK